MAYEISRPGSDKSPMARNKPACRMLLVFIQGYLTEYLAERHDVSPFPCLSHEVCELSTKQPNPALLGDTDTFNGTSSLAD